MMPAARNPARKEARAASRLLAAIALAVAAATPAAPCAAAAPAAATANSGWVVKDAPFRAVFRLLEAPIDPEAGTLLELPEFGQTRPDLGDVFLTDAAGGPLPAAAVYSRPGSKVDLLVRGMISGAEYFVYCGGGKPRAAPAWSPRTSLLLETRPVNGAQKADSWSEMESLWRRTPEKCDGGFVNRIFEGGNPFGQDTAFMTHATGYINPPAGNNVFLFTVSADASFVLVNDRFEFGWPGKHSGNVLPTEVRGKAVTRGTGPMKIDYYQIKGSEEYPASAVMGWKVGGQPETIPEHAWLHPGKSELVRLEEIAGQPVPNIAATVKSYLGYGGEWFYQTAFSLRQDPPEGWSVSWQFEDGVTVQGPKGARILTGADPQLIQVRLTRENTTLAGIQCVHFPDETARVKLEQPSSVLSYVRLINADDAAAMRADSARARVTLLVDYGTDEQIAKFAPVWLRADPNFTNPITIRVFNAVVHAQAEADPRKALEMVRALPAAVRDHYGDVLSRLEIDLLVFYLRDPNAEARANQLSFSRSNTETGRLMLVRVADAARILGKYDEANTRYQKAAGTQREEPAKAAAQDQANSMTIASLLEEEHREEAAAKLIEWEVSHPQAELTTDLPLLHARVAMSFGRWTEARTELESYAKMAPESPYQIDTQFYLAEALAGAKLLPEARAIWARIAKDYPHSPLAEKSKEFAAGKSP